MVLRKDLSSPLEPQSDDEKTDTADPKSTDKGKDREKDKKPVPETRIDFDGISQRILSVPVPEKNYATLSAGKEGVLFLVEQPSVPDERVPTPQLTVQRYDLETRREELVVAGIANFQLSRNGEKALIKQRRAVAHRERGSRAKAWRRRPEARGHGGLCRAPR